ncbi:MAG: hypothetical protein ACRDZO_11940 [Egibacteraceae bacterium]
MLWSGMLRQCTRASLGWGLALVLCAGSRSGLAQAQETTEGFPVTVEHCGGTLTFEEPPSRVVSGYQPAFETLVAMGLGDRLIGRLNFGESITAGFLPVRKRSTTRCGRSPPRSPCRR